MKKGEEGGGGGGRGKGWERKRNEGRMNGRGKEEK